MAPVRLKTWTRKEYDRMVDSGLLGSDDRVELLDGEIVEMTPQSGLHANVVHNVSGVLRRAYGDDFQIRCQLPGDVIASLSLPAWEIPVSDLLP